jgi:branched-chain amino acid transport system ATP-binding protein
MLDELSMGLAPIVVDELYKHVVQLAAEGITVVVVEQFARTALAVASSAMVMANGRIVQTGSAGDVESILQSAYLGSAPPAAAGPPARNGTSDHPDAAGAP